MLPVRDETGRWVAGWSLVTTVCLVAVSLLPSFSGWRLPEYAYGRGRARGRVVSLAGDRVSSPDNRDLAARKLFFASIAYLPLVLGALVATGCSSTP